MTDRISPKQFHESEGVEDWRVIGDGACAYFRMGSFAASARLVHAISQLPGVEDHKPDVDLRHDGVTVRLITYTDDYYRGIETQRPFQAAEPRSVRAEPHVGQGELGARVHGIDRPGGLLGGGHGVLLSRSGRGPVSTGPEHTRSGGRGAVAEGGCYLFLGSSDGLT